MLKEASFSVKKVAGKAKPWCVDIPAKFSVSGRRERRFYSTRDEAKAAAELQR